MARTDGRAVELGMTAPHPVGAAVELPQPFGPSLVARIEDTKPGTVHGGWAQIGAVHCRNGAGRVAGAAGDAVSLASRQASKRGPRVNDGQLGRPRVFRAKRGPCAPPHGEKRGQRDGHISNNRVVWQRLHGHEVRVEGLDTCGTSETRDSVDQHGARPAHANPTRASKREGAVDLSLRQKERIEHRHPFAEAEPELTELAAVGDRMPSDPQGHRQRSQCRQGHRSFARPLRRVQSTPRHVTVRRRPAAWTHRTGRSRERSGTTPEALVGLGRRALIVAAILPRLSQTAIAHPGSRRTRLPKVTACARAGRPEKMDQ